MRIKWRNEFCRLILIAGLVIFSFSCSSQVDTDTPEDSSGSRSYNQNIDEWTLMFYFGGDNTLNDCLSKNVSQLVEGYCGGMRCIVLLDNEDSTRMYQVSQNGLERLYGNDCFYQLKEEHGESNLNTADAVILRNFIRFCKTEYPAEHYGLIIGSHGGGVRTGNQNARAVVQDVSSDSDWIFTAELTDVLTEEESVDVLGFDACFMASLETVYQFCGVKDFSAQYIVASPAEEWSNGWNYKSLAELFADEIPSPADFAESLVNNYKSYIESKSKETLQTLTCLRSSDIPSVKDKLDKLSCLLVNYQKEMEVLRGKGRLKQNKVLHYFNSTFNIGWLQYAYFDLYSLAEQIEFSQAFSQEVKAAAEELKNAVDEAVVCSYSGSDYSLAKENKTGLSIFFPNGKERCGIYGKNYWDYQYWYNALSTEEINNKCYGKLAFCTDGAEAENGIVENWFELLDKWFDTGRNINRYIP